MIRTLFRIGSPSDRRTLTLLLTLTGVAACGTAGLFALLIPLFRALFGPDPGAAVPIAAAMAGLAALTGAVDWLTTVIGQRSGAALILRCHELIAARVAALPLGFFDEDRSGTLGQLVTRGVVFAANAPNEMLRPLLQGTLVPVLSALALFAVDWRLGGCALAVALGVAALYRWVQRRNSEAERAVDAQNSASAARVLEFASAQPAVRAAGPDSIAERSVRAELRAQLLATERVERGRARSVRALTLAAILGTLAMLATAVGLILAGSVDVPTGIAGIAIAVVIGTFAIQGLPFGTGVELAGRTLAELDSLLAAPLLPEPDSPARPADTGIELAEVSFAYPGGPPVLSRASFRVPAGSTTAIVGPSGSGKSTIARLIARFHEVDGGEIRIGGRSLPELGTAGVLAQLSMVFQDVILFEDTLRENIRLGRPGASDAEVERAAASAGVLEIVARLPLGFETPVGERGGTLSGGERQRVSIARALLKGAPILLLDEATAALDSESEALVQRALDELAAERTTVVIAHRLQTIRGADQVVVLDGAGGIEAVGPHEQLLGTSPTYARFWAEREETQRWRIRADG